MKLKMKNATNAAKHIAVVSISTGELYNMAGSTVCTMGKCVPHR
jgi:hypothetical protein